MGGTSPSFTATNGIGDPAPVLHSEHRRTVRDHHRLFPPPPSARPTAPHWPLQAGPSPIRGRPRACRGPEGQQDHRGDSRHGQEWDDQGVLGEGHGHRQVQAQGNSHQDPVSPNSTPPNRKPTLPAGSAPGWQGRVASAMVAMISSMMPTVGVGVERGQPPHRFTLPTGWGRRRNRSARPGSPWTRPRSPRGPSRSGEQHHPSSGRRTSSTCAVRSMRSADSWVRRSTVSMASR